MTVTIHVGDCREVLKTLPDESVQCVVTSPPYWGLRSYGTAPQVWDGDADCCHVWGDELPQRRPSDNQVPQTKWSDNPAASQGQNASSGAFCQLCGAWRGSLGLEPDPELYTQHLVEIFRDVRRVLRDDGTMWLNLGDSYASQGGNRTYGSSDNGTGRGDAPGERITVNGLKPKDLVGIPWRVAFALQADGWWWRQWFPWVKTNAMPMSREDAPGNSVEVVHLFAKSRKYYFDMEGAKETLAIQRNWRNGDYLLLLDVPTLGFSEAHFATFPPALVEPMIKAGCPVGGVVLDPFGGAGTVGLVADRLNRDAILIELNPDYAQMARRRIQDEAPMFANVTVLEEALGC